MTPFALTLAYWLHMVATVVWIGGLAALAFLILPTARKILDPQAYSALLGNIQKRLDPMAWFSLIVLAGTGLFQMSLSPNYTGFLAINNRWAAAILVKHIVFFGMTGISAYLTWGVLPGLQRAALRRARGQAAPEASRLEQQELALLRANLILAVLVLALTAIARAS